jgi:hypothetical protein
LVTVTESTETTINKAAVLVSTTGGTVKAISMAQTELERYARKAGKTLCVDRFEVLFKTEAEGGFTSYAIQYL